MKAQKIDIIIENKEIKYAGFWLRFFAGALDLFLIALGMGLTVTLFAVVSLGHFWLLPSFIVFMCLSFAGVFFFIGPWLYFALFYSSRWQATPGMRALNIKICDYNYQRIGFLRSTGRYFAESIITSLTFGIGYLMIVFTRKKQALHDMIAETYVIRE